jgi:UPF0042 nucleotide-binding protein
VIEITSFGYGHPEGTPDADLIIDLRPYRDPHVRPEFRHLTAFDAEVRDTVRSTPGIPKLLTETLRHVDRLATNGRTITIATGCVGGRHRGPAFALDLQAALHQLGHHAAITHRDINKPVIQR